MGKRITTGVGLAFVLALVTAHGQEPAQPPPPVAYDVAFFNTADQLNPFRWQRRTLIEKAVVCNLESVPGNPDPITNPTAYGWDDPENPGRMCRADLAFLRSTLPDGTYRAAVRAVSADGGESDWTAGPTFTLAGRDGEPFPPPFVCSYAVTPASITFPAEGGLQVLTVTPIDERCTPPYFIGSIPGWVSTNILTPTLPPITIPVHVWAAPNTGEARAGILSVGSIGVNASQAAAGAPPPPVCPAGAVSVLVGDWSRNVSLGAFGRVTYNLQLSTAPVTTLVVKFDGAETDRVTGSDLRKVAGSYFKVPAKRGSYALSVEAQTAAGCTDGATRPMSVNVR